MERVKHYISHALLSLGFDNEFDFVLNCEWLSNASADHHLEKGIKMPKKARLFFLLASMFFSVGCGGNVNRTVTFYQDEAWKAGVELSLPGELIALMGSPEALEADIIETVADWEEKGANIDWESRQEDTTIIYSFSMEGQGLSLLNEIVFENRATLRIEEGEGQRQIYISYRPSGDLSGASYDNVTLHGREVISSNGNQIDSGTVQWENFNGRLEAVLTEKSQFSLGTLLLILGAIAATGGGGWYIMQRRQETPVPQLEHVFCSNCGESISPQAKFCPKCGKAQ